MVTVGQKFNPSRITKVACSDDDSLYNIDIKEKSFLLLIITEGNVTFRIDQTQFTATAPCFICFNELHNPIVVKMNDLKYKCIYFHPQFLNINMSFSLIRSYTYSDIAYTHDMFLLKPFTDDNCVIPVLSDYIYKTQELYENIKKELDVQRDWYWSCRSRSYFIELIIIIERLYGLAIRGDIFADPESTAAKRNIKIKKALSFIESHYSEFISLKDIVQASESNHTTIGIEFFREFGQTPIEYLWNYRINIAKKQLAFTDVPLKEISVRCGFKTNNHFSRMFKQITGNTPARYRIGAVQERKRGLQV